MASWHEVEESEPEFAARARGLLDARAHKTIATLRRDGSPRISGIEATFVEGDLWFGSMWRAVKALDLQRDPRVALHSGAADPPDWTGDAKVAGRVAEIDDDERRTAIVAAQGHGEGPPGPFHLFRIEIEEVVVTRLGEPADHLVIELWRPGEPLKAFRR